MSVTIAADSTPLREADVLVIGGGPAATWAALTAREEGARVVLVDKGYCGSSGVAAASTIGHWWVAPDARPAAMAAKDEAGGHLSEFDWMERILDETWHTWPRIADRKGYLGGGVFRMTGGQPLLQGPVYLKEMRRLVRQSGVEIFDHAPALELLMHDGAVCGAAGLLRKTGEAWTIKAASVILATGGCAYRSGCLGAHNNAGDGYLMAAEAGARLSGMEFGNYFGLVAEGCSVDKNGYFLFARYFDAAGREIEQGWSPPAGVLGTRLASAFLEGPVYAQFTDVAPEQRMELRAGQPNLFIQFDRLGIDPFTQRFAIEPLLEGTVRGTAGVEIVDAACWTGVKGLWVAGDTASRERITGASSGAGSANAAWTVSSGRWSGIAAARHALDEPLPRAPLRPERCGRVGIRPSKPAGTDDGGWRNMIAAVHDEVVPLDKNGLRTGATMRRSLARLDTAWNEATVRLGGGDTRARLRGREAAAMLATARLSFMAALIRTESRGMHVRTDHSNTDPDQRDRILIRGVDDPRAEREPVVIPEAATS